MASSNSPRSSMNNFISALSLPFSFVRQRVTQMDSKAWIQMGLWLLTLALIFIFIGVSAGFKEGNHTTTETANAIAGAATALVAVLFAAIITTVVFRVQNRPRRS